MYNQKFCDYRIHKTYLEKDTKIGEYNFEQDNSNKQFEYFINNFKIKSCLSEKILGVIVDCKLTFREHIYQSINKASRICNLIVMNMKYADVNSLVRLYKCFARPILEYASVIFSPHHKYLIDALENVQRRFTKKLAGQYNLSYLERLKVCNLDLLETRRLHSDVVMVFKILHGFVNIDLNDSISVSCNSVTRGNNFKLKKYYARLDIRKYFFVSRCVDVWNNLPCALVNSRTSSVFASNLYNVDFDCFLKGQAIE
jgi:hypothetical protein